MDPLRLLQTLRPWSNSGQYWERRYARGGNSGKGSYGDLAAFKAGFLNDFVATQGIDTVIEFGCGDGAQLALAHYPRYLGFDVSDTALSWCRAKFAGDSAKFFKAAKDYAGEQAALALSLDVVFHLLEDHTFDLYMRRLFFAAERFVIIYSSDFDQPAMPKARHVRHRRFSAWVRRHAPDFEEIQRVENPYRDRPAGVNLPTTQSIFVVYRRTAARQPLSW